MGGGLENDSGHDLVIDAQDSVWVTGETESFGAVGIDMFLAKFSSNGSFASSVRWGGSGDEQGNAIAFDAQGSIWVTDETKSFGVTRADTFLTKFSPGSNMTYAVRWGSSGSDSQANAIAIDAQGSIWVSGVDPLHRYMSLAQFSPAGNLTQLRTFSHLFSSDASFGKSLAVGNQGELWLLGAIRTSYVTILKTDRYANVANIFPGSEQLIATLPVVISNQTYFINNATLTDVRESIQRSIDRYGPEIEAIDFPVTTSLDLFFTGISFYQHSGEVNQIEISKGVEFTYAIGVERSYSLADKVFSGRYEAKLLNVQLADGTALPDWLHYNSKTGVLKGVWPVNSEYDRLALRVGHRQTSNFISLELVSSGSPCAKHSSVKALTGVTIKDMAYGAQGALWVLGDVQEFGAVGKGIILARFSSEGSLTQALRWGGINDDSGVALATDAQGAVWITVNTKSFGAVGMDVFLAQFSSGGTLLQALRWGGGNNDRANALAIDAQNSVWVTGYTNSFGGSNDEAFLIKLSPDGNVTRALWWDSYSSDRGEALAIDAQGAVWVVGTGYFGRSPDANIFLIKFSSAGNLTRAITWGGLGAASI